MPDTSVLETVKTVASAAIVPVLAWALGRGNAAGKAKLEARAADQTDIRRLSERIDKLEGRVDTLMTEKFALEQKVVALQTEIGTLKVEKAQYELRDATTALQIKGLEVRLAAKEEELLCAQKKLKDLEDGK